MCDALPTCELLDFYFAFLAYKSFEFFPTSAFPESIYSSTCFQISCTQLSTSEMHLLPAFFNGELLELYFPFLAYKSSKFFASSFCPASMHIFNHLPSPQSERTLFHESFTHDYTALYLPTITGFSFFSKTSGILPHFTLAGVYFALKMIFDWFHCAFCNSRFLSAVQQGNVFFLSRRLPEPVF